MQIAHIELKLIKWYTIDKTNYYCAASGMCYHIYFLDWSNGSYNQNS